ncbi:hypothetical protein [Archangium lansingense]|uniref:Uncharacterized protein n=1 Tax=Archangium lansingense TaxID=2995310 RepID=A0ABT4AKK7_9BACT|nr:hypothetical protein [Archangium lansinium]MCY1081694.1 hypothetical protein [Archangium lansinium]
MRACNSWRVTGPAPVLWQPVRQGERGTVLLVEVVLRVVILVERGRGGGWCEGLRGVERPLLVRFGMAVGAWTGEVPGPRHARGAPAQHQQGQGEQHRGTAPPPVGVAVSSTQGHEGLSGRA